MAGKRPTTIGPQAGSINMRAKVGGLQWGGMWPDGDAASPPDNRFRLLRNVRLRNGAVHARPGQSKLNSTVLHDASAMIGALHDFTIATPYSLWLSGDGCPSVGGSIGFFVGSFDQEQYPQFQPCVYYDTTTQDVVLCAFDNHIYAGQDTNLRRLSLIRAPWGSNVLDLIPQGSFDQIVLTLTAGFTGIKCLAVFDGMLFIGADNGPGASQIWTWDGVTEDIDLTGINTPTGFVNYRESLILGYNGAPNHIRVRDIGGTWATYAPGAGTCYVFKNDCGCSYRDVAYWATNNDTIGSFNGTAVTMIGTGTTGLTAGVKTQCCRVFNGCLYVTYYDNSPQICGLLKYDGVTWTPVEKDFVAQWGGTTHVGPMQAYRNNLVVGASRNAHGYLFVSPQDNTAGTWEAIVPSAFSNGGMNEIVTF